MTEKSQMGRRVDALFRILPAESHRHIATKMTAVLGQEIKKSWIGSVLLEIRRNRDKYQWTVPPAQRGRGEHTFIALKTNRGSSPMLTTQQEIHINEGCISTVMHSSTSLRHQAEAFVSYSDYLTSPSDAKRAKSIGRKLKNFYEDIYEFLEDIKDRKVS